jgi:hypothetical protein
MPRTPTDAELIVASGRDPVAFRALYDRWADRLLAYFYRRVLDPEVAADLLAETFAVAFERRRRFRDVWSSEGSAPSPAGGGRPASRAAAAGRAAGEPSGARAARGVARRPRSPRPPAPGRRGS